MKQIKKYVIMMLACIGAVLLSSGQAYAREAVEIQADSVEGKPGDIVTVTFAISKNPGTTMYEMRILYDNDALKVHSVERGETYPDWFPTDITLYPLYISAGDALSLDNLTESCVLAKVQFRIAEDAKAGEYRFRIKDGLFLNGELDEFDVSYDDSGCITVKKDGTEENTTRKETEVSTSTANADREEHVTKENASEEKQDVTKENATGEKQTATQKGASEEEMGMTKEEQGENVSGKKENETEKKQEAEKKKTENSTGKEGAMSIMGIAVLILLVGMIAFCVIKVRKKEKQ